MLYLTLSSNSFANQTLTPERRVELNRFMLHDCGACHGMRLTGGLGPALTPEALQHKQDGPLIDTILNGRQQTAMPPWKDFLTEAEAAWMIRQLKLGNFTREHNETN